MTGMNGMGMAAGYTGVQTGNLGVNLSVYNNTLRTQSQMTRVASQMANNRNVMEIGGVWVDQGYIAQSPNAKIAAVNVKAMSNAYFRILEKQPSMKQVFQLGNHIVWVTPSGTPLVVDLSAGQEEMPDADIDRLFQTKK